MNSENKREAFNILELAIREMLEQEAERLIQDAKDELERRTPEIIAGIVVDLTARVEIESLTDRFVFTIKKDKKDE